MGVYRVQPNHYYYICKCRNTFRQCQVFEDIF